MERPPLYYFFCDHGTQGGIGYAFPKGIYDGKLYKRSFFGAYNIYKMLDAVDEFPGLKVTYELDSYAFEEVLKEDPEAIAKLKKYLAEDKAGLVGGTYAQPLGQDYGWEPNIRQLVYGREVVKEIFDYEIESFLVEEQWFHPQLPQLLKKSGFKYASLQNQNSGQVKPMNKVMINWLGIDGSQIPTIPANDLLVSCVRQYADYSAFQDIIKKYENPLFFQWVEIWPPGMDWGASATPFAKGIEQIKEWGGDMVTLEEFFNRELPNRQLEDIYIKLDESNYANDWYQTGGWGYDGDKVIMEDKLTESVLLAFETSSAMDVIKNQTPYPLADLNNYWKRFMLLQNHDFSVARNYRAYTEDGLKTEAASLAVVEYQKIRKTLKEKTKSLLESNSEPKQNKLTYYNTTGVKGKTTVNFIVDKSAAGTEFTLIQNERELPYQLLKETNDEIEGLAVIEMPAVGCAEIDIKFTDTKETKQKTAKPGVQVGKSSLEDNFYSISWKKGSWDIEITDKITQQSIIFTGFTGPIAKQNEHDVFYPALSPGHKKFSFAFEGATHSPDQLADITAYVEESGPIKSTLVLRSDLLTLHTTDTPVAFAEARVSLNHVTGKIQCQSYFYTGVNLGLNCYAEFKHNLEGSRYYRDFPFGEEETKIEAIYPNTYIRVEGENNNQGFTLVHPGVQRAYIERKETGGKIKHLLARDKVFGEYRWTFDLNFGKHTPAESIKLSKLKHGYFPWIKGNTELPADFLSFSHDNILLSAIYFQEDALIIRLVNYSIRDSINEFLTFDYNFSSARTIDFMGNETSTVNLSNNNYQTILNLPKLKPWEIISVKLDF